jgi:hypothetical protein
VLVPGYSLEPHNVLDHIWQSYIDSDGTQIRLTAQVYYTTFLNAVRSFYDLEEYPIDIAGVFIDHIYPSLTKGFRMHYPNFGKARPRAAITQRTLLMDMLNALIKAEASVSNILKVVGVAPGGKQFLAGTPSGATTLSFPSVAEQTITRYTRGNDSTKGSGTTAGSFIERKCWGCGLPHPWSKKEKGKFVIICPNADKPGIREHASAQIKEFQERKGHKHARGSKRRNVNTLNWEDIPTKRRAVLLQQHHTGSVVTTDGGSVASSITGATTTRSPSKRVSHVTLHQDVVVLAGSSSLPLIPVAIHSPMAHITLQTGTAHEEKDCPNLRCVFDTGAALSTANFHFMEAVVRQYPHILKQIYMPAEYATIVLSRIVTTSNAEPITTELPVGFEIHLPYPTKNGSETSLLVAAGPDVAVNLILGLPFIKATGMIGDFVDNVCQAKHLVCGPFPIDFKRATKSIPVFTAAPAPCNVRDTRDSLHVLASLALQWKLFPPARSDTHSSSDRATSAISRTTRFSLTNRWIPPVSSDFSASSDTNDYHHQVLGDLGYL